MRLILALLLLAISTAALRAQEIALDRVDIVETGIYKYQKIGQVIPSANTASGKIAPTQDRELVKATATIPARVGTDFGVRFTLLGKPNGAKTKITFITRYPAQGLRNPDTGKTTFQSEYEWEVEIGKRLLRTYGIDHDWEAVPGEWALEFWYKGRKLGGQTFTTVAP